MHLKVVLSGRLSGWIGKIDPNLTRDPIGNEPPSDEVFLNPCEVR